MKTVKEVMLNIYKIVDCLPAPIRNKVKDCINRGVKGCILEYRKSALIVAGAAGLALAFFTYNTVVDWLTIKEPTLKSSITILALSLPTLFILWMFRTHDTQENINNSTFFECARLLTAEDLDEDKKANTEEDKKENRIKNSLPQKIALTQLAYLRRKTSFDKEKIDSLTKNLFLYKKEFSDAQFSGINLYHADLRETILMDADLTQANLIDADLTNAKLDLADLIDAKLGHTNLSNTKLRGADLMGADLRGADLSGAELIDAKLIDADLSPADLINIDFPKPANLSNTKLGPNYFRLDDLINNDYSRPADLTNADLRGADLTQAKLDDAKLKGAIYNDKTDFTGTSLDSEEARDGEGMIYQPDEEDPEIGRG